MEDEHQPPEEADIENREAISRVCRDFAGISELLNESGELHLLESLAAALRAGRDVSHALEDVHAALQRGGDPVGVHGGYSRHPGVQPDLFPSARPATIVFLCPARRCSRHWLPEAGSTSPPVCEVSGTPLRWEKI